MNDIVTVNAGEIMEKKHIDNLWSKIEVRDSNVCWEWRGARNKHGYGITTIRNKQHLSHRIVWLHQHGVMNLSMKVLHRCDNPPCCNPSHLFLGTQSDNVYDMIAKGRRRNGISRTSAKKGEENYRAKVKNSDVEKIRELRKMETPLKEIARQFGIHVATVSDIVSRRTWKHIE